MLHRNRHKLAMLYVPSWSFSLTSKEVNSSCGPMVFWNSPIIRTFNHMLSCRIVLGQFFNLVEKLVSLTPVTSVTERLSGGYTEALPPYLWSAPCLMGIHLNQDFPERHPSVLNPRGVNCKSFSPRASIGGRLLAFQYLQAITTVCTLIIFWILSVNSLIPHQLLKQVSFSNIFRKLLLVKNRVKVI